jgi:drug/metabolite transporter (DMT)-like permease
MGRLAGAQDVKDDAESGDSARLLGGDGRAEAGDYRRAYGAARVGAGRPLPAALPMRVLSRPHRVDPREQSLFVPLPMSIADDDLAACVDDDTPKRFKYLEPSTRGKGWGLFRKLYKSARAFRSPASQGGDSIDDEEPASPRGDAGSRAKAVLMLALVVLAIFVDGLRPVTLIWAKDGQHSYPFDFSEWILIVKIMVVGFSALLYAVAPKDAAETTNSRWGNLVLSCYLVPPTLLYLASDVLSFPMFRYISASTFSIVKQSRLAIVGLLFRYGLGRYISQIQWIAIAQLLLASMLFEADVFAAPGRAHSAAGTTNTSIAPAPAPALTAAATTTGAGAQDKNEIIGIAILLIKCLLDSLAIVWMDKFFKVLSTTGFPYPLQQLYFAVYGLAFGAAIFVYQNYATLGQRALFEGWNRGAWASAMLTAFYGLLVSIVLRYLDSIIKMIQSLLAVVLTIFFDYLWFGESITGVKIIAILYVLISVFLYKLGTVKKVKAE